MPTYKTLAIETSINEVIASKTTTIKNQLLPNPKKITSVSRLSEIQSTDWAFQALQSLQERYGLNYRNFDEIFNGKQAITRYEFAAALNTAIAQINQLIVKGSVDLVRKEDLATLQRLQQEFATELATFASRVDNLEAQVARISTQQFSTTTQLTGEVLFALNYSNGGEKADSNDDRVENNAFIGNRVRLNFNTSFTGQDRLRIRLQARTMENLEDVTGTSMARLGFEGDNDNEADISRLQYRFSIGEKLRVYLEAAGGEFESFTDTIALFSSSGRGSISRFGRLNPIYRQAYGTGVGFNYELNDAVSLSLGYIADDADDPDTGIGKSPYGAIVQLTLEPTRNLDLGLTYVRSYNNLSTGTGSELANDPFDDESDAITANSYGIEAAFRVSSALTIGGWVGFTSAVAEDISGDPEAQILNYAVSLAFPDFGKEGNLAGIVIGQPPKVISNDLGQQDNDTSLHLEVFYRFLANDNIAVTPGLLVITNPEHNNNNDTVYVGTIRTTFSF